MIDISLVIPAYNEESSIGPCIEAAIKNGRFKEIIVANNNSTDKTAEIAGSYPGVRVVLETRKGTGNARQTGNEHANSEILAFIDADTEIPEGWADTVERIFTTHPEIVFLSGPYQYRKSNRYPVWLLNIIWSPAVIAYWLVGYVGNGGNSVMRKDALDRAGGHDRTYTFYGDDTDLAQRLHKQGKTVWKNSFFIYTLSRRFDEAGLISMCVKYVLNYWWPVLFHRPFNKVHEDIRLPNI